MTSIDRHLFGPAARLTVLGLSSAMLIGAFDELDDLQGLLLIAYTALFSTEMALRLRPSVADFWRRGHLSKAADALAWLPGVLLALPTLGALTWGVDLVGLARQPLPASPQPLIEQALIGLGLAVVVAPCAVALWRRRADGEGRVGPYLLCIVSAIVLCGIGAILWLLVRQTIFDGLLSVDDVGGVAAMLPSLSLGLAAAGLVWWRAIGTFSDRPFDVVGILEAGTMGARCGLALALLIGALMLVPWVGAQVSGLDTIGLAAGLVESLIVSAAWMIAFRQLDRLAEDNWAVAAFSLAALFVLLPASLGWFALLWTLESGWALLMAVIYVPLVVVDVVLVLVLAKLLALVSRRARRFTVAPSPRQGSTG